MRTFAINENLAGVLALVCTAAVIFAIALDADAGLGPAGHVAATGRSLALDPGNAAP